MNTAFSLTRSEGSSRALTVKRIGCEPPGAWPGLTRTRTGTAREDARAS